MLVTKRDGSQQAVDPSKIYRCVEWACRDLMVDPHLIIESANIQLYDGVETATLHNTLIQAAAELVSPTALDYTYVAARLVLLNLYKEVSAKHVGEGDSLYPSLASYIAKGVYAERLDERLLTQFDLAELDKHINPSRDFQFDYLGIQSLADRYFVRRDPEPGTQRGKLLELPQHFFMRVAMGLALNEKPNERVKYAIEFYNTLSTMEFMNSTPTLFNAGTLHPQMSSCYLNQLQDEIFEDGKAGAPNTGIFAHYTENALLSKFAGGIGSDWTPVRSSGSVIKSTGGLSSGIVPWLKIENDLAVAVNQGGKRNGAIAAYLEPWHPDAIGFMDLKKKVGDPRMRAHELFTAWWIPDLFMRRVLSKGEWSFIDPHRFPDLHELWGNDFVKRYEEIEESGAIVSKMPAADLWRKMITAQFEEGGPWITFKDESNRRNPQQHIGVVHNSNLCTEITLVTSATETAVCNLGSVNLPKVPAGELGRVIKTAMRMLDNVIDLNFYPVEKARHSNMQHRPVGLGLMGWMEYLVANDVDFESETHLQLVELMTEAFSYFAIDASVDLAAERGPYPTYKGSFWSKGILPIDTARPLPEGVAGIPNEHRAIKIENWEALREKMAKWGIRNSNCMAIAPTATIANICATTQSIEPSIDLVTIKKNLSGKFKVICPTVKYGRPHLSKVAYRIDPKWVVQSGAIRQRWLDQAQSLNLFARAGITGREIGDMYFQAWALGCKTTYYLQTERVAEEVDKDHTTKRDTTEAVAPGYVSPQLPPVIIEGEYVEAQLQPASPPAFNPADFLVQSPDFDIELGKACSIDNPDCESCQ